MTTAVKTPRLTSQNCRLSRKKSPPWKRNSRSQSTHNSGTSWQDAVTRRRWPSLNRPNDFRSRSRRLTRVQLDDQLLIDDRLHLFARRNMSDLSGQGVAIHRQPIGNWSDLRQFHVALGKLARFRPVLNRDLIAGLHIE